MKEAPTSSSSSSSSEEEENENTLSKSENNENDEDDESALLSRGHLFDAFKFTSVSKNPLVKISMRVFEKFLPDLFVKRRRRTKEERRRGGGIRNRRRYDSRLSRDER
mmetsp:Transcript_7033/g.23317  ORF Transcript_7033/g.23317 Transcript_7033/m.23317 type:complete len:108 (+) Transcript_7033:181-504(+)